MLIFNCTKAAADFFTTIKRSKKISPIEPAPHKTIAEAIEAHYSITNNERQWHWLVHAKKVKRKNVLIVMEYQSRFSLTLTGLKKGDELAFLNLFEHHLTVHIHEAISLVTDNPQVIEDSLDNYHRQHHSCAFYQRGDRSVQSHINDVFWHFEQAVLEIGEVFQNIDLIGFDTYANRILRNLKDKKDYCYPQHELLRSWLIHYGNYSKAQTNKMMQKLQEQERIQAQSLFDDIIEFPLEKEDGDISDEKFKNNNVVSLDAYRKKQ